VIQVVPFTSQHATGVIDVVRGVHDEYGFTWEAAGYHRDLYDIDRHYLSVGGMFWVLLEGRQVAGCAGVTLHGEACELHRLYLRASVRGRGWGRQLLETTMQYGRDRGCRRMVAWSDVVLKDAHALYKKAGFIQEGTRLCDDPDNSTELGFWKEPI
jgi:GNAT superfamily N-acetyltransferase